MSNLNLALTPFLNPDGKTVSPQWLLYLLGENRSTNDTADAIALVQSGPINDGGTSLIDKVRQEIESLPAQREMLDLFNRISAIEQQPTINQSGGGMQIKSIQRGVITIAGGTVSATATITAVNPAKSELRYLGNIFGGTILAGFAYLALTNATTITATRGGAPVDGTDVSWELTEWY